MITDKAPKIMRYEITIPRAADNMETCEIAKWHKPDSSMVKSGDLILTLETDKISQDVDAIFTGTLTHHAQEGSTVKVGDIVGFIEHDGSEVNEQINQMINEECPIAEQEPKGLTLQIWSIFKYFLMILGVRYLLELILK